MLLQPPPNLYQLRDQDAIRKILEMGLNDVAARIAALEAAPPVVNPPPVTGNELRFGMANGQDIIGFGPKVGGWALPTGTDPYFQLSGYDFSVTPSQTSDLIDKADQHEVTLVWGPSGGRFGYINAQGFNRPLYEQQVRRFASDSKYADAVARRRIILSLGDEFNHPAFLVNGQGTAFPADLNWAGNLHKSIWPNALTTVRMAADTLRFGWNGSGTLNANFWTGLDYGWSQRSGQHNNSTLSDYYSLQKSDLANADLGMILGFNWWNGGIKLDNEGVSACWDTNADGFSSGYIIGSVSSPGGSQAACGSIVTTVAQPRVVASPDYIKHWADVAVLDTATPFTDFWVYPVNGPLSGDEGWATALANRADYVNAFKYAINKLNSRASFDGYRDAKRGVPV